MAMGKIRAEKLASNGRPCRRAHFTPFHAIFRYPRQREVRSEVTGRKLFRRVNPKNEGELEDITTPSAIALVHFCVCDLSK